MISSLSAVFVVGEKESRDFRVQEFRKQNTLFSQFARQKGIDSQIRTLGKIDMKVSENLTFNSNQNYTVSGLTRFQNSSQLLGKQPTNSGKTLWKFQNDQKGYYLRSKKIVSFSRLASKPFSSKIQQLCSYDAVYSYTFHSSSGKLFASQKQ